MINEINLTETEDGEFEVIKEISNLELAEKINEIIKFLNGVLDEK